MGTAIAIGRPWSGSSSSACGRNRWGEQRALRWRGARPIRRNGTGKSHLAQAIGQASIQQGYRVLYRETHKLLDDLAEATLDGIRKECMELFVSVPLLIIDDLGMSKLPMTAVEDLLEIVMRRYERASTLLTSNRPVDDWGKLLGDSAAVTAMLDRLLHHGHVLKCGPRSWRTKTDLPLQEDGVKQPSPRPLSLAGFEVTTVGRF